MGKVNVKRAVENIRASTTVYTPIVEVIINAIQAIESTGRADGIQGSGASKGKQTKRERRPVAQATIRRVSNRGRTNPKNGL